MKIKELGFSDDCFRWWLHENLLSEDPMHLTYKEDPEFCYCPLYDQAFLFLFRKFKLHHEIFWDVDDKCFKFSIVEIDENGEAWDVEINSNITLNYDNPFDIKDIILTEMLDFISR